MSMARWVERAIWPYLVAVQAAPILALTPLISATLGYAFNSRVLVVRAHLVLPGGEQHAVRAAVGRSQPARAVHAAGRQPLDAAAQAAVPRRPARHLRRSAQRRRAVGDRRGRRRLLLPPGRHRGHRRPDRRLPPATARAGDDRRRSSLPRCSGSIVFVLLRLARQRAPSASGTRPPAATERPIQPPNSTHQQHPQGETNEPAGQVRRHRPALWAVPLASALLVAACGSDKNDSGSGSDHHRGPPRHDGRRHDDHRLGRHDDDGGRRTST